MKLWKNEEKNGKKYQMNLIFTCSVLSAQKLNAVHSLIVCIFNLNSNENIHIGLLYHLTTSVQFFFSFFSWAAFSHETND